MPRRRPKTKAFFAIYCYTKLYSHTSLYTQSCFPSLIQHCWYLDDTNCHCRGIIVKQWKFWHLLEKGEAWSSDKMSGVVSNWFDTLHNSTLENVLRDLIPDSSSDQAFLPIRKLLQELDTRGWLRRSCINRFPISMIYATRSFDWWQSDQHQGLH